jgi:hypothetical protein
MEPKRRVDTKTIRAVQWFYAQVRRMEATMIEAEVEDFVPLPTGGAPKSMTYHEVRARAQAACNTAGVLISEGYEDEPPNSDEVRKTTRETLRAVNKGDAAPKTIKYAMETPEGAYHVNSILTQYDMDVVHDAKRLRHYVTNRLVLESENPDPRIRMKALELLGKVSDVGLFTERTEITVNNRSTVDLENSLRDKLRRLMGTEDAEEAVVLAPPVDLVTPIDVDAVLG